jgi:hypothetical protein
MLFVTAVETREVGRTDLPVQLGDAYYRTVITLGWGAIVQDCAVSYDAAPKITVVDGVAVTAFRFDGREDDGVALYQAEFTANGVAYRVELHDSDSGEDGAQRLAEIVCAILRGAPAELSALEDPDVPELRFDALTPDEARADTRFGAFVPSGIPGGFAFESAYRVVRPETNNLSVHWGKPDSYLEIHISEVLARDLERVVHPDEREKYDMARYPIPLSESVPRDLWEVVTNPVFPADELTPDVVTARVYQSGERGEGDRWKASFSILYEDTLVRVTAKGMSPEQLWDMIQTITR